MRRESFILFLTVCLFASCVGYNVRSEIWNGGESYMYEPVVDKSTFNGRVVSNMSAGEAAAFYDTNNKWFYSGVNPQLISFVDTVEAPVIKTQQFAYGTVASSSTSEAMDVVKSLQTHLRIPFYSGLYIHMMRGSNFGSYDGKAAALTHKQGIFMVIFNNMTIYPQKEIVYVDAIDPSLRVVDVYGVDGGRYVKHSSEAVWEIKYKKGQQYLVVKMNFGEKGIKQPFRPSAAIAIVVEQAK